MSTLKIRVGVAIDANVGAAFQPILTASRKARAQVESDMAGAAKKTQSVYRQNASEAARAADKAATEAERAAQREVRAKEKALAYVARIRDRHFRDQQRQEEKAAADASRSAAKRAEQTGYWSVRYAGRAVGAAGRFGMDMARGAGVNLNMGSIIGKAVSMEKRAVDLANASIGTGVKGNETRASSGGLLTQARDIGISAGYDPERVLEGLQKFVAKTGDLKTGRDMLADLARLSSATGSELEDMVDAAGDVSNALGEVPNKGKVVESVMRAIAGQGKVGAVEMKDLAVQMAKLGAAAGAFEGDSAKNVEMMGIFAQMARARGGAASATQAATSVAAMVNTFKTPARIAAFKAEGIDVLTKSGMVRNPFEILKESLTATQGNPERFKKMFANVQGARAVEGFATVYRQAGGGQKGLDAVSAEFERLKKASISKAAVEEAHAERMKTNAAKIEVFNAKLTEVGARVAERVLPQMDKLAPTIISAVDNLGALAAWVAENPLKASFALVGASMVRAAGETILRAGIEAVVKKGLESGLAAGFAGKGLALGAVTLLATAAYIIAKEYTDVADQAEANAKDLPALAAAADKQMRETGTIDKDTIDALARGRSELEAMKTVANGDAGVEQQSYMNIFWAKMTGGGAAIAGAEGTTTAAKGMGAENIAALASKMDALIAAYTSSKNAVQQVHVVNQTSGTPSVDPSNRTGPDPG